MAIEGFLEYKGRKIVLRFVLTLFLILAAIMVRAQSTPTAITVDGTSCLDPVGKVYVYDLKNVIRANSAYLMHEFTNDDENFLTNTLVVSLVCIDSTDGDQGTASAIAVTMYLQSANDWRVVMIYRGVVVVGMNKTEWSAKQLFAAIDKDFNAFVEVVRKASEAGKTSGKPTGKLRN